MEAPTLSYPSPTSSDLHEEDDESYLQHDISEAHLEKLQELASSFLLSTTVMESHLPDLNPLERSFVIHQHRLLRLDHYIASTIPHLDLQFSELKHHLKRYRAMLSQIRRMSKKTKACFKRCVDFFGKAQQAWQELVLMLDAFCGDRKKGSRGLETVLGTYEGVKLAARFQGWLRNETMKLERLVEEQGGVGSLLVRIDKLVASKVD
jgi:hypothetical protein